MSEIAASRRSIEVSKSPNRLTVFAFLWACQALVHQDFYSDWQLEHLPIGWILTGFILATLIRPSSIWLFSGMLVSSIVYNVLKWPFVVNHILVESLINATILAAIASSLIVSEGKRWHISNKCRESIYDRFAPVVMVMLILVYYFAFIAKLNWDFVNPEVSCVVVMYGDLLRRFPFLPSAEQAGGMTIASTLVVEAAIPLLLTFRRTRYFGVLVGVPFHIVLGLVGHRTFSALAFALYGLICMRELVTLVAIAHRRLANRLPASTRKRVCRTVSSAFILCFALLVAAELTGQMRSGIGPLKVYRLPWIVWGLWSLILGSLFAACAWQRYRRNRVLPRKSTRARPGLLWAPLLLVALNGMSQYLGLKTETCFTMYSNLRTEGGVNNHMFVPTWKLSSYQEDLVEIVSSSIPELQAFTRGNELLTSFELRRLLSSTAGDFEIVFKRSGKIQQLYRRGGDAPISELLRPHPLWQAKLLHFRPVSTAKCAACQH
ncbi:MAG: hypothetical protein H8E66_16400 [Planctomycetes bacterium]|nr:hypothetical protein [Planctomycetota bacterium]